MTKRFVAPAVLAALLLSFAPLHAEDPPHLDFVRGLRERRYPDLALEYLQKLSKDPPADLDAFLQKNAAHPLAATVRLDLARVTVLQGKTQLTRALREETRAAKQAGADKA